MFFNYGVRPARSLMMSPKFNSDLIEIDLKWCRSTRRRRKWLHAYPELNRARRSTNAFGVKPSTRRTPNWKWSSRRSFLSQWCMHRKVAASNTYHVWLVVHVVLAEIGNCRQSWKRESLQHPYHNWTAHGSVAANPPNGSSLPQRRLRFCADRRGSRSSFQSSYTTSCRARIVPCGWRWVKADTVRVPQHCYLTSTRWL